MEEQSNQQESSLFGLTIDLNSRTHLSETAGWTRFLAIAGFIFIGLMICWGILMPAFMENNLSRYNRAGVQPPFSTSMYTVMMLVYVIIFGSIYFFPCLFTLRFSNRVKKSLRTNDQEMLSSAFKNLKITVRYLGVLTIIFLSIFIIALLVFVVALSSLPPGAQ